METTQTESATKKVFVASSREGLDTAERVAAILEEVPDVKPCLWTDEFRSGDITLLRIEELAGEVAGALIVATPDDQSKIRGEPALIPRANVIFEYAFFSAALGRQRVALCKYDAAQLPSDLSGVTHIPMGKWPGPGEVEKTAKIRMKDWARKLAPHSLSQLGAAIAHYESRLKELQQTYRDVLDGKVEQSRRAISFQLEIMEEKVREAEVAGRSSEIWILGINATGPLHQGREILIRTLSQGGKLRLLLLDPNKPAFQQRCAYELDGVGRIVAELRASLHILIDVIAQASPRPGDVEVRLHDRPPDRSLLMIDCASKEGIVMENPYPALKGKRGLEGEMYPLVQRGRTTRGYRDNVAHFNELWEGARPIALDAAHNHRMEDWPFSVA